MSFRKSFRNTAGRRSSRYNQEGESRGSTP
jgi:hypothetical protein